MNEKMIDELINQLDEKFLSGIQHIDIVIDETEEKISMECTKNKACTIPNLLKGLDNEEENIDERK